MTSMIRVPLALLVALVAGCAQQRTVGRYSPGDARDYYISDRLQEVTGDQFERGKPRAVLDAVGCTVGVPSKIVLWNRRVDRHWIAPATELAIAEYLAVKDVTSVKVMLNQYAP